MTGVEVLVSTTSGGRTRTSMISGLGLCVELLVSGTKKTTRRMMMTGVELWRTGELLSRAPGFRYKGLSALKDLLKSSEGVLNDGGPRPRRPSLHVDKNLDENS